MKVKTQKKFTVTVTTYEANAPDFVWKFRNRIEKYSVGGARGRTYNDKFSAKSITLAMDKVTEKNFEKRQIKAIESWLNIPTQDRYNDDDLKYNQNHLNNISETIISEDGLTATAHVYSEWNFKINKPHKVQAEPQTLQVKHFKVEQITNQVMKSDYIKSNSKLAKWIHKRFVKYADQLGVSVPRYYINRRDIVERMGEYAVAKTSDSGCIGRCWYGSGIIWIDVNYHDKKWGSDQKAFRKNIDHTIAHEMVHLRFHSRSDPLHVRHDGSKQRRAFDRRTNQVLRGKQYQ